MHRQPNLYRQPHLTRPTLPLAWHPRIRIFCEDVDTMSAVLDIEIRVLIVESETGELSVSALAQKGDDETRNLLRKMCDRVMDAMAYVCVVCGELGECYQIHRSALLLVCCVAHLESHTISIRRGPMSPVISPWRRHQKMSSLTRIATNKRAASAALSFYDRHNAPFFGQILAEAEAARARIAVDSVCK